MRSVCLLSLTLVPSLIFAQPPKIIAESTIQNVTVFSSGAQIGRTATIAVLPGRSEIVFSGLSNQLVQQSVQLKADANITLLSVQAIKDHLSQRKIEQDERNLLDRRSELRDKNDADARLLQVYKHEEEMLIKNQAIGGQNGVKTEELKLALDLQRQRLTEVYQRQMEIEKRIKLQQQESERINAQLLEISKKKDSVNYTVAVVISSKESKSIKFQLLYTIKDAGWYPTYDIRVSDISQPLSMLMNANIFQRSGETWKDISIQLSTGSPDDNQTFSPLSPWRLGFYDPSVSWTRSQVQPGTISGRIINENGEPVNGATIIIKGTSMTTTTDGNGYFKMQNTPPNGILSVSFIGYVSKEVSFKPGYYTISLSPATQYLSEVVVVGYQSRGDNDGTSEANSFSKRKKEEIQTVAVTTQYQPTTIVYRIEEKYSIETDGKTTTIGVKKIDVPALYEYYSAPRIDPSSFLKAKIINWQDYDLQPGEANLYYEGTYLGKTYIDLASVSDTLSLSLGKDNGVVISRKLLREYSSKKLIGSNKTETKEYEIRVRNTKKTIVNVVIGDQFPVSITKEINVEDVKASEGQIDKETGIVTWNIQLQPGQEKRLQISYSVKYPKDRLVV